MTTMTVLDHEATAADLKRAAAEFMADPTGWPAAMAARTLRARNGHKPYSAGNMALITWQLTNREYGRNLDKGLTKEEALREAHISAADMAGGELAPKSVWGRRGYHPVPGSGSQIWGRPFTLWVDGKGAKCDADTPGARERRVFKREHTFPAAYVNDEGGVTAELEFAPPELPDQDARKVFNLLKQWITSQGWRVSRNKSCGASNGTTVHANKTIVVHSGLADYSAVETLAHEIGHALLHGDDDAREYSEHRGDMECEAESVAYAVLRMLGQDELAKGAVAYTVGWQRNAGAESRAAVEIAAAYESVSYVVDALAKVIMGEADVTVTVSDKAAKVARKRSNRELAAECRAAGFEPSGEAWARVKGGESVAAVAADILGKVAA